MAEFFMTFAQINSLQDSIDFMTLTSRDLSRHDVISMLSCREFICAKVIHFLVISLQTKKCSNECSGGNFPPFATQELKYRRKYVLLTVAELIPSVIYDLDYFMLWALFTAVRRIRLSSVFSHFLA